MTLLGRNELCPCGSGKKYKKCCLNKDAALEISNRKVVKAQKQYSELYDKLYEYSRKEEFSKELETAKEMFYIVNDESINAKFERFFNTYYIQDHILEDRKVLTVSYYESNKDSIGAEEFKALHGLFESYPSVYEVIAKDEKKIKLKNCLVDETIEVDDLKLLSDFEVGEHMIARAIKIEDTVILIDVTLSISSVAKDIICNDIISLFQKYEDIYKDIKTFLIYHTHVLYKYMQQLLEPKIADHLKKEKEAKKEKLSEIAVTEDGCHVTVMLSQHVEAEYLDRCIEFWNEYKSNNEDIKGSENGWAAAVEYHVKKVNGEQVTQPQVSKKYDISPSTLGKRYKDIKK